MQKHVSYIGYCDNGLDPLLYYYYFFIKQGSVSKQAKNIELYIAFYTQELQSTLNNLKQHFEKKTGHKSSQNLTYKSFGVKLQ